jgi:hypothetical protein
MAASDGRVALAHASWANLSPVALRQMLPGRIGRVVV